MSHNAYLITGGLGVIGTSIIRKLTKCNPSLTVVVVDSFIAKADVSKIPEEIRNSKNFHLTCGDCINEDLILHLLREHHIECVIDCASHSRTAVDLSYTNGARNALQGITHVLDAVREYGELKSYVLVSSETVYGNGSKLETSPLAPTTFVGAALMGAEALLHSYVISYRLPCVIARLTEGIMENVIQDIDKGLHVSSPINLISAEDAASAILKIANVAKDARIYNVGGKFDYDIKSVTKSLETNTNCLSGKVPSLLSTLRLENELHFIANEVEVQTVNRVVGCAQVVRVLLFSGSHPLTNVVEDILHKQNIVVVKAITKPGTDTDEMVKKEIVTHSPHHVIYLGGSEVEDVSIFEGGPQTLKINLNNHLLAPWLVVSFCQNMGIKVLYLEMSLQENLSNKETNSEKLTSYNAVQQFTNKLFKHFSNVVLVKCSDSNILQAIQNVGLLN